MCKRLPGPRCADHTGKAIVGLEAAIVEAKKSGMPTVALEQKLTDTKFEYYGTFTGQNELKTVLNTLSEHSNEFKSLEEFRGNAKAEYDRKDQDLKVIENKEKAAAALAKKEEAKRSKVLAELTHERNRIAQEIEDVRSGAKKVEDVTTRYAPRTSSISYARKGGK